MSFRRFCIVMSSLFGSTGVAVGAFGAHALSHSHPERLATLKTAVQYQLLHAAALLVLSCIAQRPSPTDPLQWNRASRAVRTAALCMVAGTVFFSSSLLLVAIAGLTMAGAIAPIGGTLLIVGWISLAFYRS